MWQRVPSDDVDEDLSYLYTFKMLVNEDIVYHTVCV